MISYYLGYLQDKKGNKTEAAKFFKEASAQPVDYGFPFRLEDEKVLALAAKYHPTDAKPLYYLGNLLYDKQPKAALESWEKAVKLDPALATAWRNLGWGYYYHLQDVPKAIGAYEKACSLKNDEPVYYAELDPLYEMSNAPIEKRYSLFEGRNEVVRQRDDAFVRQILVLNLAGKPDKSVEYLNDAVFHFREGSSRVRDITVDAHLLLGQKLMAEKKYTQAIEQFLAAVGTNEIIKSRTGDIRSPQVNYFIGLAYEALGNKAKAKTYFTLSTSQPVRESDFVGYYQGLSYQKIGNKTKAAECFNKLVDEGNKRLKKGSEVDFFAKFGEKETAAVQMSNAHLLVGLGQRGLGNASAASENLKKAVDLSASNLWANFELKNQ
jgi:tetratricopeptide (TPR) repeat protein